MRVLVYGGTGSQMRPIVGQLLARGDQACVLTRDAERGYAVRAPGVEIVEGDLDAPESLKRATSGVDGVAFLIPAFLSDPSKALIYADSAIRAAADAGVRHLVWNTSSRLPSDGEDRGHNSLLFAVWDLLKASGLSYTIVAPTTYMENLLGPWTANSVRSRDAVSYPVLADRRMGWIASADVCALIVSALGRTDLAGRVFRVSGVEAVTGQQLAEAFSDALGRTLTYQAMTPREMRQALDAEFGPGAGVEVEEQYAREQADPSPPPRYYDMDPVLRDLPVAMTTLRQWVRQHASHFAKQTA